MSDALSRRYAQAIIELADEAGAIERVGPDLADFDNRMKRDDALLGHTLESPVFTAEERKNVLDQLLPRIKYHPLTTNLLYLLNDRRRFAILPDVVDAYAAMADTRAGRVRVTVETAEPLTPQLEGEVRASLEAVTGRTVILHTVVKPELIGGLVARIGDMVIDSSLRTRLENMKQALLQSPIVGLA